MAEVTTFTSLQTDMRRYLERGEVTDETVYLQLPRLINLAEREIAKRLKIQGFINNLTSSLVAGTSTYAKPDRWRETISMEFGTGEDNNERRLIFPRSYEYCRNYWPNSNLREVPEFYADYNYSWWLIVPTPVAIYPWQINYYQQPPYLDAVNQTNWLSDFAPSTLLYRCLLEATPFLKNDARIPTWEKMYESSIQSLSGEDLQKIIDRTTTRQEA